MAFQDETESPGALMGLGKSMSQYAKSLWIEIGGIVALIFIGVFLNIIFILGSELSKFEPDALQNDMNMLIDYGMELIGKYIPDNIQENMKSNLSSSASSAILFIVSIAQRVVLNFISNIAIFAMQLGVVVTEPALAGFFLGRLRFRARLLL